MCACVFICVRLSENTEKSVMLEGECGGLMSDKFYTNIQNCTAKKEREREREWITTPKKIEFVRDPSIIRKCHIL